MSKQLATVFLSFKAIMHYTAPNIIVFKKQTKEKFEILQWLEMHA